MSDYDSKSIPVLDDIVGKTAGAKDSLRNDTKVAPRKGQPTIDDKGTGTGNTAYTNNIFNKNTSESLPFTPVKQPKNDPAAIESALIDYDAEETAKQPVIKPDVIIPTLTETLSMQSISDDIVKQLMPKLERQLRLLLKQALKEKLPEETINITSTTDTAENSD